MSAKRLVPLSGVAAVALIIAAFGIGGDTPGADASVNEVVSFYTNHGNDQMAGGFLLGLGAFFLLVFATTVAGHLRRAEGEAGGSSALSFAGGAILAVGLLIFAGLAFTVGDVADTLDPSGLQTLHVLGEDMFMPLTIGNAAFLIGAGIGIVSTAALPKWLGWMAIIIGVAALTPFGFYAFALLGLWTLIASVMLAMRAETA